MSKYCNTRYLTCVSYVQMHSRSGASKKSYWSLILVIKEKKHLFLKLIIINSVSAFLRIFSAWGLKEKQPLSQIQTNLELETTSTFSPSVGIIHIVLRLFPGIETLHFHIQETGSNISILLESHLFPPDSFKFNIQSVIGPVSVSTNSCEFYWLYLTLYPINAASVH